MEIAFKKLLDYKIRKMERSKNGSGTASNLYLLTRICAEK